MLEAAIAVFGLLVLWGLPYAGGLYFAIARPRHERICSCAACSARSACCRRRCSWARRCRRSRAGSRRRREGVAWLGFFYGGNIAGAVFGCLLAGFYLLRVHDMAYATYVAVAIDVVVALASLALAQRDAYHAAPMTTPPTSRNALARFRRAMAGLRRRSHCPARRRSPPRRCGRDCCRCCSARRRTRSR